MKQLGSIIASFALVLGVGVFAAAPAGAINVFEQCTDTNKETAVCEAQKTDSSVDNLVQTIVGILSFVIGIVSVIMIIVGGIRYTLSNGDAGRIKSAKDTVLYSVIGLVISLLAYVIVNFVVGQFT